MMQIIRDKAQGIVAWVIVAMIAFVLCFWGVSGYIKTGKDQVLAKVNGRKITAEEVDNIYNRWLRISSMQPGFDMAQVDPVFIKRQITVGIAQQAGTVNGLLQDGMAVSEAMIIDSIRSKQELQEDGKFSITRYKQLLQEAGLSEAEFEEIIADQLLISQLQLAVLSTSFATPREAEQFLSLKDQSRDFGYTIIAADKVQKGVITDQAIEEFYNAHQHQFVIPEKVQVEYIELSLNDIARQTKVDEQKLQEYYKANVQAFTQPKSLHLRHIMILAPELSQAAQTGEVQKQINDIYKQLQDGASFTELAKKYSEDKQSARTGGDIGWVNSNDDYPSAVFALQKNGDYTKPVQMEYGWHIFQLIETKGGDVKSFASVRDVIAERYKHDESLRMFSSKGDEIANLAFENPTSLTIVSEKTNLPIKTSEYFTAMGGPGIAQSSNVVTATFNDDVLNNGHNSDLLRVSDDNYVVLRIKDKKPAHTMPLEEARTDIIARLKHMAAKKEAENIGAELIAAIKQSNNPNKAASAQNLNWNVKQNVLRDNKDLNAELLAKVFSLPRPIDGQAYTTQGFSLSNGDYVVVALTKVRDGIVKNSADSNLLEKVARQIATYNGQTELAAIQAALIDQAKIKYTNDIGRGR